MKPHDDPWLKNAHANAEHLDREIKKLAALASPIRENKPVITKYQDFWNQAKKITVLFKELKPLAQSDRDLLWNRFNMFCGEVKGKQKGEYGVLESRSKEHLDEIMRLLERARLPQSAPAPMVHDLVERGQVLKKAGDHLAKYKHEMIAKHKKAGFDRIQEIRKTHDAAWGAKKTDSTPRQESAMESKVRRNLEANRERYKKASNALENFQIGRGHIREFLATSTDPQRTASAEARLAETEARIRDIDNGMKKLEKWIADDERLLGKK